MKSISKQLFVTPGTLVKSGEYILEIVCPGQAVFREVKPGQSQYRVGGMYDIGFNPGGWKHYTGEIRDYKKENFMKFAKRVEERHLKNASKK